MTLPVLMLLSFAMWTIVLLVFTVGVYRWTNIFTRKAQISDYRSDNVEGSDWYKRAMRAHANCVENLPVFGVVVFAAYVADVTSTTLDYLCITIVIARIAQSIIHVTLEQTNFIAFIRFCAFLVQIICFVSIAVIVLTHSGVI